MCVIWEVFLLYYSNWSSLVYSMLLAYTAVALTPYYKKILEICMKYTPMEFNFTSNYIVSHFYKHNQYSPRDIENYDVIVIMNYNNSHST